MNYSRVSTITATGTVRTGRTAVTRVAWVTTASAGIIVLRDGGASGTTIATIDTSIAAGFAYLDLGEKGVLFETDVHATLTNISSLMTVYIG